MKKIIMTIIAIIIGLLIGLGGLALSRHLPGEGYYVGLFTGIIEATIALFVAIMTSTDKYYKDL